MYANDALMPWEVVAALYEVADHLRRADAAAIKAWPHLGVHKEACNAALRGDLAAIAGDLIAVADQWQAALDAHPGAA